MIHRPGRTALALACAAILAGCLPRPASAQPQPIQVRALVGCYQAGDWSFALDSVPAMTYWDNVPREARQAWNYGTQARGDVWWLLTPGDTVEVREHNGMDGATRRFAARGRDLVGTGTWWSDIVRPPRPPDPIVAQRVECPGPPTADGPPPNPEQLQRTFMRGLADVLRDSVKPRYPAHLLPQRPDVSRITRVVSSILGAWSHGDPETIYGWKLDVEPESLTRNEAVAIVVISLCKDQPEPLNLYVERIRYRFVRAPGKWQLVSSEPLGRTQGECGNHLPEIPQP